MTFKAGESGNRAGRPPKANATAAKLRELITADDVQGILTSVIEQAKAGDLTAAKIILDRVLPSLKSVEVQSNEATEPEQRTVTFHVIHADGYSPENGA